MVIIQSEVSTRPLSFRLFHVSFVNPSCETDGHAAFFFFTKQVYVQKVSPQKTPMVVGKLLDLDCSEDFIRQLLNSVGHQCPVDELVEQVKDGVFFFLSQL